MLYPIHNRYFYTSVQWILDDWSCFRITSLENVEIEIIYLLRQFKLLKSQNKKLIKLNFLYFYTFFLDLQFYFLLNYFSYVITNVIAVIQHFSKKFLAYFAQSVGQKSSSEAKLKWHSENRVFRLVFDSAKQTKIFKQLDVSLPNTVANFQNCHYFTNGKLKISPSTNFINVSRL